VAGEKARGTFLESLNSPRSDHSSVIDFKPGGKEAVPVAKSPLAVKNRQLKHGIYVNNSNYFASDAA
jgi:hypothetical protein